MYGVIEYNNEGKVKCELCGQYFDAVCSHVNKVHKMSAREYKLKFGFKLSRSILSPSAEEIIKKATADKKIDYTEFSQVIGKNSRYQKGCSGRTYCSEQERLEIVKRFANR